MLSQAIEDYLKTIYKLSDDTTVSTTEIAAALGVSSASVTNMVKRMSGMGLVSHRAYQGVTLTTAGKKIALEIIRHHRLLETYLKEIMGYGWEKMHDEAERLEHHISEEFEDRLDEMLGYPTHDPHGDPIPTRDGQLPPSSTNPLSHFSEGDRVFVHRLSDRDPVLLARLESIGILPRVRLELVDKGGKNGSVKVRVGVLEHRLSRGEADSVFAVVTES